MLAGVPHSLTENIFKIIILHKSVQGERRRFMRVKVFYGILGITLLYASLIQALGLAGVSFGDLPIVYGWKGGLLPTPLAMLAMWLLRFSFCKPERDRH